jgi:hypothetical protein
MCKARFLGVKQVSYVPFSEEQQDVIEQLIESDRLNPDDVRLLRYCLACTKNPNLSSRQQARLDWIMNTYIEVYDERSAEPVPYCELPDFWEDGMSSYTRHMWYKYMSE